MILMLRQSEFYTVGVSWTPDDRVLKSGLNTKSQKQGCKEFKNISALVGFKQFVFSKKGSPKNFKKSQY